MTPQQPIRRSRKPVLERHGFLPWYDDRRWEFVNHTRAGMVSVIIPAYNCFETLTYALKSCVWQTQQPDEIVVVNDDSTDKTGLLVDNLAWVGIPIAVIHHDQNRGAAAARNTAIRQASGEFIIYLDADDMMPQWRVQDTVHEFALTGADLIYGQKERFVRDYEWRDTAPRASAPCPRTVLGATGCGTCAVSTRRSAHVDGGVWMDESMSVAEDAELLVACLSRGMKVHCSPKVYCWRRESDTSLRHRGDWTLMRQWIQVKHRTWLEEYTGRRAGLTEDDVQRIVALRRQAGWLDY